MLRTCRILNVRTTETSVLHRLHGIVRSSKSCMGCHRLSVLYSIVATGKCLLTVAQRNVGQTSADTLVHYSFRRAIRVLLSTTDGNRASRYHKITRGIVLKRLTPLNANTVRVLMGRRSLERTFSCVGLGSNSGLATGQVKSHRKKTCSPICSNRQSPTCSSCDNTPLDPVSNTFSPT